MTAAGLYIHVPFCAKKCPYCDFYSVAYRAQAARDYTDAVCRSMEQYPKDIKIDTIYFGGGTPSILPPSLLAQMLSAAYAHFSVADGTEITLEVNPSTATEKNLEAWKEIGINRLSFGVQSCNDDELSLLGRRHTAQQALSAVERAARLFDNISCDLMLGVPRQTKETLEDSVNQLTALPIRHISAYLLSIEEGTPFDCDTIRTETADEETMSELYCHLSALLAERGFSRYEISNFAHSGFESRHNLKYWQCVPYIGLGPAAHSCFDGKRYSVPADLTAFCRAEIPPREITDETCFDFEERVMLGLRLCEGICLSDFSQKETTALIRRAAALEKAGYVVCRDGRIALTTAGILVSNAVIGHLLG